MGKSRFSVWTKSICTIIAVVFGMQCLMPAQIARADILGSTSSTSSLPGGSPLILPVPGAMVNISPAFVPILLRGVTVHPNNPFAFDFIVDSGMSDVKSQTSEEYKAVSQKLVNYFLASMTVPEKDLWVNLSPNEPDRIVPNNLGKTELGRDLLAEDYILKQLTASLMQPDGEAGRELWEKIYSSLSRDPRFRGDDKSLDIPTDIINKVWILPESATIYEHNNTVYITDAKLKVMTDRDYNSSLKQTVIPAKTGIQLTSLIKQIIIPEIEKEVNTGKNFAQLRQIYYSLILAKWYKDVVRNSILQKVYVGKNKVNSLDTTKTLSPIAYGLKPADIYKQYMSAFKQGVYSKIKEEYDPNTQQIVARKYFSGGFKDSAMTIKKAKADKISPTGNQQELKVNLIPDLHKDKTLTLSDTKFRASIKYNGIFNLHVPVDPAIRQLLIETIANSAKSTNKLRDLVIDTENILKILEGQNSTVHEQAIHALYIATSLGSITAQKALEEIYFKNDWDQYSLISNFGNIIEESRSEMMVKFIFEIVKSYSERQGYLPPSLGLETIEKAAVKYNSQVAMAILEFIARPENNDWQNRVYAETTLKRINSKIKRAANKVKKNQLIVNPIKDKAMLIVTKEEALDYQQEVKKRFESFVEATRQSLEVESTDAKSIVQKIVKTNDSLESMFYNILVNDSIEIRKIYDEVQQIVREELGKETDIINMNLDEIHVTISNEDIDPAGSLTLTLKDLADDIRQDIQGIHPFNIKLIGPLLMSNGAIIMEYTTDAPEFLYLRKKAEQRIKYRKTQKILSDGNKAFVPNIFHSTVAVIRDPKVSKEKLKKIFNRLNLYRREINKPNFQVTKITATRLRDSDKRFVESVNIDLPNIGISHDAETHSKKLPDSAALAVKTNTNLTQSSNVGGIDMSNVGFNRVDGAGPKIEFNFIPTMLDQLQSGEFNGFQAIITNVTALPSVLPLLGLAPNSTDKKQNVSKLRPMDWKTFVSCQNA
ncbi:MAG: hypothetical protein HQL26_09990 [Candidatus Omnitrophica bacterium]|nr:hypothetical protein [Candidatus Omnitrophota bacterium]